jgi:alpha-galactosidase
VQAAYRGPRLYDAPETRNLVKKWVDFYKKHRAILDSDIIHVRRADGRDIDCILHVNPDLEEKGLAMVYNPLDEPIERKLTLPLYYTGLKENAEIRIKDGKPKSYKLNSDCEVEVPVHVEANGVTWLIIE